MNYKDIKTFTERCEHRPPHMAEIQLHLHEEIAELRHFIEWHLLLRNQSIFSRVRTIPTDGRCLGWDGQEINTAA